MIDEHEVRAYRVHPSSTLSANHNLLGFVQAKIVMSQGASLADDVCPLVRGLLRGKRKRF